MANQATTPVAGRAAAPTASAAAVPPRLGRSHCRSGRARTECVTRIPCSPWGALRTDVTRGPDVLAQGSMLRKACYAFPRTTSPKLGRSCATPAPYAWDVWDVRADEVSGWHGPRRGGTAAAKTEGRDVRRSLSAGPPHHYLGDRPDRLRARPALEHRRGDGQDHQGVQGRRRGGVRRSREPARV